MTVSNDINKEVYAGNGTTGPFDFPHYFFSEADIVVIKTSALGVETTLTLTTDYTVDGEGVSAGGSVTTVAVVAVGEKLTIIREVELLQEDIYVPNDPLPAKTLEAGLDRLTMAVQQINEKIERSILFPISSEISGVTLPTPDAGKGLKWNAAEDGLENTTANSDDALAQAQAEADDAAASAAAAAASAGAASSSASASSSSASSSSSSASASSASATLASQWASLIGGLVASTDYSAKEFAIGSQSSTGGSSKNWAQYTVGDVPGAGSNVRSAKAWAQSDLKGSTFGGSSRDWAITPHNTVVDGATGYSARHWAVEAAAIVGAASGVLKVTTNDTTASVLNNKISVVGMTKQVLNPGANEQLELTAITKVKQIVTASITSSVSTNATSFADVTGFTASITPTSTSNKILVIYSALLKLEANAANRLYEVKAIRNASTEIEGNSNALRVANSTTAANFYSLTTRIIVDSPATTSSTSYKLQHRVDNSGCTGIVAESGNAWMILIEFEP